MTRARRPDDWTRDLEGARAAEARVADVLSSDRRVEDFEDHTDDFDTLDFSFTYDGARVHLDLKEKKQRYSAEYESLWPEVDPRDLFIVDETVYRRIVWQGGGGYLLIHDHPGGRWVIFGPWELTLGPRVRYQRWGRRRDTDFAKGKILLDLGAGAHTWSTFSVDDLLSVIERARRVRDSVEAVEISGHPVPEVGRPEPPDDSPSLF